MLGATPSPLHDFLHGGRLPFAGRRSARETMAAFGRSIEDRSGPAILLLSGEEGQGKSRLIEEMALTRASWGALAGATLEALSADLESRSPTTARRAAARGGVDGGQRLRHLLPELSRARPHLLALDQCDLLPAAEALRLAGMLRSLPPCMLGLVIAGRPPLLALASHLEFLPMTSLQLEGLAADEVGSLWESLLGQASSPSVTAVLQEECDGRPLLLKQALRHLLQVGWINIGTGRGQSRLVPEQLKEIVRQCVRQLVEGRLAALTAQERTLLRSLALLGSCFARESALLLLGDEGASCLDRLEDAGVLGPPARLPYRLAGPPVQGPLLQIQDSLVARFLRQDHVPPPTRLVECLRGGVPLHSPAVFRHLAAVLPRSPDKQVLLDLLGTATQMVTSLEREAGIDDGETVATALLEALDHAMPWRDDEDLRLAVSRLLAARLFLLKGKAGDASFRDLALDLMELGRHGDRLDLAETRLLGCIHLNRHYMRHSAPDDEALRREMTGLLDRHPTLRHHRAWLVYLGDMGLIAWGRGRHALSQWVRHQFDLLLAQPVSPEFEHLVRQRVGIPLLCCFETRQEAEARLAELRELERTVPASDAVLPALGLHLLLQSGRLADFLERWEEARQIWQTRELSRNMAIAGVWHRAVLLLCGETPETIAHAPTDPMSRIAQELACYECIMLLGRQEWLDVHLDGLPPDAEGERPIQRFLLLWHCLSTWSPRRRSTAPDESFLLAHLPPSHEDDPPRFAALLGLLQAWKRGAQDQALAEGKVLLEMPVARLDHLLILRVMAALSLRWPDLAPAASAAQEAAFAWCAERQLGRVIQAWCRQHGRLLTTGRKRTWMRRAEQACIWNPRELAGDHGQRDNLLHVQVFGRIRLRHPGSLDWHAPGGRRCRILLSLLVANAMLRKPLGRSEFRRMATGGDDADPAARTRTRHRLAIAVHRLREMLGAGSVLTGSGLPQLNLAQVRVDALEAWQALHQAEQALREQRLLPARDALGACLALTRRGTLFPDLYEALHEALRDDLESRLQRTAMDLTKQLVESGEGEAAIALLQDLRQSLPDLEEARERLDTLLQEGDQRAEAGRPPED